ncbi:TRAP transporter small permease [Ferrovibrio sp.]|uniref:TRAP transporter small permease n=1 Tax=Ferrovibrio sp. TaxID=1917215 RepID=UPI0035B2797E
MSLEARFTSLERWVILPSSLAGGIALILLSAIVTGEVILRAMGIAVVGANEIGGVLLALLIFLAVGYTQSIGGHVSIEAVVNLFPPKGRLVCETLSNLICGGFSLVLAYTCTQEAYISHQRMEYQFGTMEFPLWPVKAVIAFGMALLVLAYACSLYRNALDFRKGTP